MPFIPLRGRWRASHMVPTVMTSLIRRFVQSHRRLRVIRSPEIAGGASCRHPTPSAVQHRDSHESSLTQRMKRQGLIRRLMHWHAGVPVQHRNSHVQGTCRSCLRNIQCATLHPLCNIRVAMTFPIGIQGAARYLPPLPGRAGSSSPSSALAAISRSWAAMTVGETANRSTPWIGACKQSKGVERCGNSQRPRHILSVGGARGGGGGQKRRLRGARERQWRGRWA
jgi:hypothetical protein